MSWNPLDALGLSLRAGAAELHLVRHADAVPDAGAPGVDGDYEGHALSVRGRAQAAAVAGHLASLELAALYTSPVRRARETAEAIAARTALAVVEEAGVREVRIGAAATAGSVRDQLESLATIGVRDGGWSSVPGTEPSAEVRARVLAALDGIAARHPGQRVAVVSHAGSINAALGAMVGTANDFAFPLANGSISVVRIGGGRRVVMSANESAHLRR